MEQIVFISAFIVGIIINIILATLMNSVAEKKGYDNSYAFVIVFEPNHACCVIAFP